MTYSSHLRVLLAGVGLGAALFSLSPARAATTTTTFIVTASVATTCAVAANTNLNFGPYSGLQLDGTATLTATCSTGVPYDVGLNQGVFASATTSTRKMTGPDVAGLSYSLFSDSSRSINWGNTVGVDTVHNTGSGAGQTLTVFGRIPPAAFVSPGGYSDTITVTLTF